MPQKAMKKNVYTFFFYLCFVSCLAHSHKSKLKIHVHTHTDFASARVTIQKSRTESYFDDSRQDYLTKRGVLRIRGVKIPTAT